MIFYKVKQTCLPIQCGEIFLMINAKEWEVYIPCSSGPLTLGSLLAKWSAELKLHSSSERKVMEASLENDGVLPSFHLGQCCILFILNSTTNIWYLVFHHLPHYVKSLILLYRT